MNDTKGCFDRIEYIVAILVQVYFGVVWLVATTLFSMLQQVQPRIKTWYGVSIFIYGNKTVPIAGIGQGNGLGPSLWALITSIVIKVCKVQSHGLTIFTLILKQEILLIGFAFVDNTNLVTSADNVDKIGTELIAKLLLVVTG